MLDNSFLHFLEHALHLFTMTDLRDVHLHTVPVSRSGTCTSSCALSRSPSDMMRAQRLSGRRGSDATAITRCLSSVGEFGT